MKLKNRLSLLCALSFFAQTVFSSEANQESLVQVNSGIFVDLRDSLAPVVINGMRLVRNEPVGSAALAVGTTGILLGAFGLYRSGVENRRQEALIAKMVAQKQNKPQESLDTQLLQSLQERIASLSRRLDDIPAHAESAHDFSTSAQLTDLEALRNDLAETKNDIYARLQGINLASNNASGVVSLDDLQTRIQALEVTHQAMSQRFVNLESDSHGVSMRLAETETGLAELTDDFDKAQTKLMNAGTNMTEIRQRLIVSERAINQLQLNKKDRNAVKKAAEAARIAEAKLAKEASAKTK